jgi:hypothetical protein
MGVEQAREVACATLGLDASGAILRRARCRKRAMAGCGGLMS